MKARFTARVGSGSPYLAGGVETLHGLEHVLLHSMAVEVTLAEPIQSLRPQEAPEERGLGGGGGSGLEIALLGSSA